MSTGKERIGFGAKLFLSDGDPSPTFTEVAGVFSIDAPEISRDAVDITPQAGDDRYKQFIPGLADGGEFGLVLTFEPELAGHQAFIDKMNSQVCDDWRMDLPDDGANPAESVTFSAFITKSKVEPPKEDKLALNVTMKVSGKPAWSWETP